ncbi:hypothetical protein H4R35_002586 [Dimargaris xerosporica]|nr:hypothetical protein H4R35_002586 [Dimargaris xerosporica]
MSPSKENWRRAWQQLVSDAQSFRPRSIIELEQPPSALEFMRFVARNQPFVRQVRQALQRGDAWAKQELSDEPQLRHHYYVQSQDNNLDNDFTALKPDIPNEIPFASEALEKAPDAVNFWMGDATSVTSLHKDPYENIYVVVAGSKTFTLIPPTENCCLYEQHYTSAAYVLHRSVGRDGSPQEKWSVEASDNRIPWIPVDPCDTSDASHARFPQFHATACPLSVTVNKGDMFYLPALWYHHVQQHSESGEPVIAVNYWYDMDYGAPLFPYFEFTQALLTNSDA